MELHLHHHYLCMDMVRLRAITVNLISGNNRKYELVVGDRVLKDLQVSLTIGDLPSLSKYIVFLKLLS